MKRLNNVILENKTRLKEIVEVLSKYELVKGINPEKLRLIIEDLGPTFVKLGQIMSMRSDILSEDYCLELKKLRADVKPMSIEEIKSVIQSEYNCSIEEMYLEFREKPLGSASIAQAHYAVLKDGTPVVLKIQRPKIKEIMSRDIFLLRKASTMLKIAMKSGSALDFNIILDEMWNISQQEMDFLIEAKNAETFYDLNKEVIYATCPKIYRKYTTSKILVMEYIEGVQIDETEKLIELGYDLKDIGEKLCENYVKQIVEDAFFHADPHPGNIKIRDGKIVWIDLGMVGTLSNRDKNLFKSAIESIVTHDISKLKDIVLTIGTVNGKINHARLYEDIEIFLNKYGTDDMAYIDLGKLIEELVELCNKHKITMPKGVTIFARGLITIQGVVADLSPEINFIDIVANHMTNEAMKEFDLKKELFKSQKQLYVSGKKLLELPQLISEAVNTATKGQLKINMEFTGSEEPLAQIDKMINKLVICIILAGLLIASSLICTTNMSPKLLGIPALGALGFIIAAFWGLSLVYSLIKSSRDQ